MSFDPEQEEIKEEKQEAALDTLYPKPAASASAPAEVPEAPPVVSNARAKITDLIQSLRSILMPSCAEYNKVRSDDGSKAGVHIENTRLMMLARDLDQNLESFGKFLKAEGLE